MTGIDRDNFVSPRLDIGRGTPLYSNEPQTLPQLFSAAARFDLAKALNYKDGEWKSISSAELLENIESLGLALDRLGIKKGARVAILSANCPQWTIADAACQFIGAIDVPVYTTLSPESIAYVLNNSGAEAIFIQDAELFHHIENILPKCPSVKKVIFFDAEAVRYTENAYSFDDLIRQGRTVRQTEREKIVQLAAAVTPEDIATIIYTSGTTGEPKGVMLTHANIVSNVLDVGNGYDFTTDDVCISVLPLSHIFERTAMYLYINSGMAVYFAESIEKVPENLAEISPTVFVGVPRIFEKVFAKAKLNAAQQGGIKEKIFDIAIEIAKDEARLNETGSNAGIGHRLKYAVADKLVFSKMRKFFGGNLRYCVTGGAALSDTIYLIFSGAGIAIMQGYGLTETSPVITASNNNGKRLGTVGKPIRNTQVRIAEDGEVEASGPGIMLGYYNKPEATLRAFTEDGWFRTGDIGEIDDEGFLRITDRKKELFKTSGGKYIAPSPIEQMIKGSRFVNQVVLVGNERKFASALIVPNFDMLRSYAKTKNYDLESPSEFCSSPVIIDLFERQVAEHTQGLARYETVKKIALLENEMTVESGELTPTLKVKRRVVDEKYSAVIDSLYPKE